MFQHQIKVGDHNVLLQNHNCLGQAPFFYFLWIPVSAGMTL